MAKLIILRGNSGSGKTTVAKELQKRFGRNTKDESLADTVDMIYSLVVNGHFS